MSSLCIESVVIVHLLQLLSRSCIISCVVRPLSKVHLGFGKVNAILVSLVIPLEETGASILRKQRFEFLAIHLILIEDSLRCHSLYLSFISIR